MLFIIIIIHFILYVDPLSEMGFPTPFLPSADLFILADEQNSLSTRLSSGNEGRREASYFRVRNYITFWNK